MWLKYLIFLLLGFWVYRVMRRLLGPPKRQTQSENGGPIDEMVQDPFCKTYIPLRDAQRKVIKGKEYFFCSKECADKFEDRKSVV